MPLTNPQKNVIHNDARFRVLITGRRFGKTFLAINELAKFARYSNKKVWYVAPSYRQAKSICWNELKDKLIKHKWVKSINNSDLTIVLRNNSRISLLKMTNLWRGQLSDTISKCKGTNNICRPSLVI